MQMIFDASSIPRNGSLAKLGRSSKPFDHLKVRDWWTHLSEEEQAQICRVDSPDVVTDIFNTANTAVILFKLHQKYKNKTIIAMEHLKEDHNITSSYNYQFKLLGKEVVEENLALLFSSFLLSVDLNSFKNESTTQTQCKSTPSRSMISVRRECLSTIFNLFVNSVSNFAQGKKTTFSKENSMTFYSLFVKNAFLKVSFPDIESASIQELFYKLIAATLLLENNFYLAYIQKLNHETLSKLLYTSQVFYSSQSQSNTKAESDLLAPLTIGKSISPALSTTSTSADSFKDALSSNSKSLGLKSVNPFCSKEEKVDQLSLSNKYHSDKEYGNMETLPDQLSLMGDRILIPEVVEDQHREGPEGEKRKSSSQIETENPAQSLRSVLNAYEGFYVGNLEISFTLEDYYLEGSDDEQKEEETASILSEEANMEDFERVKESKYRTRRQFRKKKVLNEVYYEEQNKEQTQEEVGDALSVKDQWYNKKQGPVRYGKYYRNKENALQDTRIVRKASDVGENSEPNTKDTSTACTEGNDDWQGESENSWGGYYYKNRDTEYEKKGRWKGKIRSETVYYLKGEKNRNEQYGEDWKRTCKVQNNTEDRLERSQQERVK